ncbi:MAG: A/G-specific adenine glycosylase [Variibacter sp.]|nr:A/G-specific adenine glycosylase [Variibacter sp.]
MTVSGRRARQKKETPFGAGAAPPAKRESGARAEGAPPRAALFERQDGSPLRQSADSARAAARREPDAAALLDWYDRHRRRLPWRAPPGERAEPYRVWLSEIMLQQTTVKAVIPYYERFLARWPHVGALAAAPLEEILKEWAGLGYYARARNLHACAKAVAARGGRFPDDEDELRALPGIGPYTAAAIAAIAFDRRAAPVDGNVERVIARLFAVDEELPAAKPRIRALAASLTPASRCGDFAQAMMDLGSTLCTPRKPACATCPWRAACAAHRRGDPEAFPRKAPKAGGRTRRGAAFCVLRGGAEVLVRTRPARGLLAGMSEVPTTDWSVDFDESAALAAAPRLGGRRGGAASAWRRLPGVVAHTFSHFPLELVVYAREVAGATPAPAGMRWVRLESLEGEAFPSLMRKVIAHARREWPEFARAAAPTRPQSPSRHASARAACRLR